MESARVMGGVGESRLTGEIRGAGSICKGIGGQGLWTGSGAGGIHRSDGED